jgi:hypothetical protein
VYVGSSSWDLCQSGGQAKALGLFADWTGVAEGVV